MLPMRWALALAAGCLVAPALAFAARGQLILSCKGQETASEGTGAGRPVGEAVLIFDFDRGLVFHDRAAEGTPIRAVKKALITWKSDDGTRAGHSRSGEQKQQSRACNHPGEAGSRDGQDGSNVIEEQHGFDFFSWGCTQPGDGQAWH